MKTHTRAVALTACLLSLAGWAQDTALQRGLQLFQQQKFAEALAQFEIARRSHPADASLANFIGITETRLGRVEDANKDYRIALRLDPRLADAHKNLGYNYLGTRQYELAQKQLNAALTLVPADPLIHYYLVMLDLSTSREAEAVPHIKAAASVLPNDAGTSLLAIHACLNENASNTALQLITALEQTSHLSAEQEYQIAQWLNERQMYAESAVRFERILALDPSSGKSQYNLALALVRAKRSKEALPVLKSLVADHLSDADLLAVVASAYETAGEPALALDVYQKAVAADPTNPDRYLDCTRLLIDLDRYEDAKVLVQQGIPLMADDYPLTIRLGAIEMMRGNRAQAREAYQKAIAEHPTLALGYVALAQTYMKEGQDKEALQILTDARTKVPQDFALEYVLGLVSSQVGDQKQAMEALQHARDLQPTVVEPHYQLGLLYMQTQEWSKAQAELEQVLTLDPGNAATYYQLSRTYQRLGKSDQAREMAKQASLLTKTQRDEAIKSQELRFGVPSHN